MKKNASVKKGILTVGVPIAIILAATLMLKAKGADKKAQPENPTVKTALTKEADKNMPLEIAGFVRGASHADVSPMVSGTVVKILKHEGESVRKGEVLAIIQSDQADAQVAAANAGVAALEKTLSDSKKYYDQLVDEAKTNRDSNPSSSADEAVQSAQRARDLQIQGTKDQLISAKGSLGIANAGKNNFTLTSPFSGTVTTVYVREGGFANFSMPIMNISTPNSLEIETYVSSTNAKNISVGSIATLKSTNNNLLTGTVTTVSVGSDSSNFKTLVRIHLNDSSDSVRLGDFLHGQIMIARGEQAISIPRNAIVSRGGDQVVFVLDEKNEAKEQSIKVASEHDGLVDVTEGLSVDQKIVTEGQQYLINGITVKPYATN